MMHGALRKVLMNKSTQLNKKSVSCDCELKKKASWHLLAFAAIIVNVLFTPKMKFKVIGTVIACIGVIASTQTCLSKFVMMLQNISF